jgi:Fe-S cluster biogenesis protein NfuA
LINDVDMKNKNDYFERIQKAIEVIRPYLQADGGDIILLEVTDDLVVKVKMTGACDGCPFSLQTLKSGVEQIILKEVPNIKQVISVQ